MLKKVRLTNIATGKTTEMIVDTDDDAKAIIGAGKAPNETAKTVDIRGADELVQRATWKKPSLDERIAFFGGMARCLERNISTIKSLELMAGRVKSPRYRGAIAEIASSVMGGEKMSDALALHPDLFNNETIALVRAGEESGQLPEVFKQIARGQHKTLRILKKLRSGLIYPAIVLVLALAVLLLMSFTLVPAISRLYGSMNVELPLATRMMIGFSDLLINSPYLAAIPVVGLWLFFKNWGKFYGIPSVQRTFLLVPVIGDIIRKSAATVSFRALSMLLQANVRILSALEITAESSPHVDFREFFLRVRDHIAEGLSLPEGFLLESHWLGPDGRMIATVIQIAGETGSANEMLDEIAFDYEEELETIANQIDKIMEPFTLVFMGCIVGFLVYAIYGPIFNLSRVVLPQRPGAQQ